MKINVSTSTTKLIAENARINECLNSFLCFLKCFYQNQSLNVGMLLFSIRVFFIEQFWLSIITFESLQSLSMSGTETRGEGVTV